MVQQADVYNLPNDIFSDKSFLSDPIIIYDYEAKMGAFKGKSVLHRNAISLVIKGEKTIHFAEKLVNIYENEFHFLSSGNCLASMDLSKQAVFKSILIFFNDDVLTDFYVKYAKLVNPIKTIAQLSHSPYISLTKDEFVYHYIDSLSLMLKNQKPVSQAMKLLKFEELMLYLLEKYPKTILSFRPERKNNFDDIALKKVVEVNVMNNLTLEELAFLCNTSLSTFKRRFIKLYGISPNKWILQRRMEKAAHLLKNYRIRPSEVFYQVGYENHSSFSQSFKHIFGKTPKEYQTQLLNA